MNKMLPLRKVLPLLVSVLLLLTSVPALADTQVSFVTAGTSSTFYPIGATICQLWSDTLEDVTANVSPSGGGIENLNLVHDGEAQVGIANTNLVYQSMMGLESFEGYADENVRVLAGLYYNPNQVVVSVASGIESIADLKGAHFSVGAAGSTTVEETIKHLSTLGMTLEDMQTEYVSTSDASDLMRNKQLDGAWIMAGIPNAAVTEIMTTSDAKILPISMKTVETLQKEYPWYAPYTIPAGTYSGQEEDVPTSAVKLTIFTTAELSEDVVYGMTKAFWENYDMLTSMHAVLGKCDITGAVTDLAGVPLHDGAAKYYREMGLMD